MSSYVDAVLAEGERIVYRASISHWKYFLSYLVGSLFVLSALGAYIATENTAGAALAMIALLLAAGLALILSAVVRRQTTELVLTDRRIITKRGLVSRDTVEINLNKVESLHVNQGLMGRILNYGDVTVVGTGASLEPLRGIARPLELRKKLGGGMEVAVPKSDR
ncbi:membrane protein [Sulfurimicrobium lacus]|uniref:Membrane protein n=1 Tax=Sulfurimicrobium lacus TaxID=2715678 RepID=A0A6F8V9F3_9PROT|nr:PH domain-containing protein [Sulfurimicrobium lacus]BCB25950.1 membrane protein [Sulfurimicrobium lacus]